MTGSPLESDDIMSDINIVPLVDIVLVLLIIFMVTANFMMKPAIDMELPKADTGEHKERNQFSLLLGREGTVVIGDRQVKEEEIGSEFLELFEHFIDEKRENLEKEGKLPSRRLLEDMARRELTMVIQADTEVTHGRVIHFIDEARKVGILKYAFNVDPGTAAKEATTGSMDTEDETNE